MLWLKEIWESTLHTEKALEDLEAAKKDVLTAIAEREARVAQELAIAERISTALEVQIEEFYEYTEEGKLGFSAQGGNPNIGLSASDQRVSKRIYTFKGLRTGNLTEIDES